MNGIDYAIVAVYLLFLIGMGYKLREQSTRDDYFLGGRSMGWKPLTLSVIATQLSAISFVSAPAFVGLREGGGLQWLSYELGVPLAMILLLGTIMPILYRSGVVSIYDYLEQRFGMSSRLLLSVVFQFSRAFATGIMVYAVSLILQGTMGVEAWQAIVITGVITLLYSMQGGMKAVVYGDAIQMGIIVLGTITCIAFGLYHLGGVDVLAANVDPSRLNAVRFDSFGFDNDGFGFLPMIFGGIVLYASYYGCDQTQAQRALSAQNSQQLRQILLANGLVRFPITILYCCSGLIIGTLAMTNSEFMTQIPAENPDWMMPIFILNYLPHGIIGLLVVAILAAAMSSLSSTINSLAAVTIEDYCRLTSKQMSDEKYLFSAKVMGAIWGVATLILSLYAGDIAPTVIEAINKVGSLFYGPILAIFMLAVLDKKLSGLQVNIGLLAGVAVNVFLWLGAPNVFWFWWNFIGFVVCVVVAYAALLVFPSPRERYEPPAANIANDEAEPMLRKQDWILMLAAFAVMIIICVSIPKLLLS